MAEPTPEIAALKLPPSRASATATGGLAPGQSHSGRCQDRMSRTDGAERCRAEELPAFTRSLLRIKVPVVVTLAENRQPLHRILELGAGTIIQFDKSCDEMLELSVGGRTIANGEAVKVGDKFGLRITSIVLPEERFLAVLPPE